MKTPPETETTKESADPLLSALRALPTTASDDEPAEARRKREARLAYQRSFEPTAFQGAALGLASRAAVPVFLAGVVALYMSWAIAAATALVH